MEGEWQIPHAIVSFEVITRGEPISLAKGTARLRNMCR